MRKTMLKFGLEKEVFLIDIVSRVPCVVPEKIPHDNEGVQVEFRGSPHECFTEAVYSLLANENVVTRRIEKEYPDTYALLEEPLVLIPKEVKLKARRTYAKEILHYENIYGHLNHRQKHNEATAGIHISFTDERIFNYRVHREGFDSSDEFQYNYPVDFVKYIVALDRAFKVEIKVTKRNPGFYEFKSNGRVEYRSLPNNIVIDKLIDVVTSVK